MMPNGLQSHLELRLGISLDSLNKRSSNTTCNKSSVPSNTTSRFMTAATGIDGLVFTSFATNSGSNMWLPEPSTTGATAACFIHPWSLAARQKAAFEQAHHRPTPSSAAAAAIPPRVTPPTPSPIVGWPPVRASRRSLVPTNPTKPEMDESERDAKKQKLTDHKDEKTQQVEDQSLSSSAMFVKVNMEGFAVGRKINLKAHDSYDSLSRALQRMFANFLSNNFASAQEEEGEVPNSNYILLYEDHEGDRMLVGDVPWELFITSVKRLYIALGDKTGKVDDEEVKDNSPK